METRDNWEKTFPLRIKTVMLYKGVTQREIADKTGIKLSVVNGYVNARTIPNAVVMVNLAEVLDVPPSLLLLNHSPEKIIIYLKKKEGKL